MTALSPSQQQTLRDRFGPRVSFDPMERRIYSHDVGTLPKLVKPLVGAATADAVVQPENERELVDLVRWANLNKVHLVPRAKATSGYGGVMPIKGGLSVSLTRLRKVMEIDAASLTARVEAGVVWGDLEQELERHGLGLRTYPSSAPSSTVGGWLAQGGVGYGAYEYGSFRPNVVSARVVLPSGEVREFSGDELDLIADAEGITGLISQVTIGLRRLETQRIRAVLFTDADGLAAVLNGLVQARAPLWSVSFIDPTMARMRNRLPPNRTHGYPLPPPAPTLPEDGYTLLLCAPEQRWSRIDSVLDPLLEQYAGRELDRSIAEHEWQQRFAVLHIKRLGPSLLPAEVVVPLDNLAPMLKDLKAAIKQPMVLEGMLQLGNAEAASVTLLGFIPHDQRTLAYGMAYALSLTAVRLAKRHGGRPFSTGLYFSGERDAVLGKQRVRRLRGFKQEVDPHGMMNPRKVIDSGAMARLLGLALPFEPLLRVVGNAFKSPVGERIEGQGRRGIPDDIAWYAYACAQCGYCVDSCDQYYGRGWESDSPRGRWFFLREYMEGRAQMTNKWVNKFLACTTCEMCNVTCPLQLPNESSWMTMRNELVEKQDRLTFPPFEMMRAAAKKELNIWGAYREARGDWIPNLFTHKRIPHGEVGNFLGCKTAGLDGNVGWFPENLRHKVKPKARIAYFAGCTASLVETDVAKGTAELLCASGCEFTYLGAEEACCGLPLLCSGHWDSFDTVMRHNIEAMRERGVKTVVTSCPACWLSWKRYYPQRAKKLGIPFEIETKHYSELLAERIACGDFKFTHPLPRKLTWHDSCHMGRAGGVYDAPREVLRAIPGVELQEMEYNRERAHCCGSVISLLDSPDGAALKIGAIRLQEAVATGADALVAACPCCEVQFRVTAAKTGIDLPVVDLAHVVAEGLGIELADPTEFAMEQWATFEAMIKLLKPEQMAVFMASMLPQMIAVMPTPFPAVMQWIKGTSRTNRKLMLGMMRPMLPVLFPRLLPGMMPKLMPDMIHAMEQVVPMPEHMKEQMPELMPEVMGNLMPKMLPEVMPYLIPRLEAYLNGKPLPKRHLPA